MQNSYDVPHEKSILWKKNDNVPGRPVSSSIQNVQLIRDSKSVSPRKNLSKSKHRKTSSSSSFQEFQDSTEDAWDVGDDEFFTPDLPIHPKVAESTAIKVLNNHSRGISNETNIKNNFQDLNTVFHNKETTIHKLQTSKAIDPLPSESLLISHHHHGPGIGIRQTLKKQLSLFNSQNVSVSGSCSEREAARLEAFYKLLNNPNTDLKELRKLSWSGIPTKVRPVTWKLLAILVFKTLLWENLKCMVYKGYLPTCLERRNSFLERKKEEYLTFISRYYDIRDQDVHHETYRQIHIDVPRMSPLVPLFQQEIVQMAFERILYILAIRHPASGYVQGMNDLVTPFFVVFLHDYIPSGADVESYDISQLDVKCLEQVETDSYWCMAKLLDGIQDNYTFAQPGIQKKVHMLKELIQRIDAPLHNHLRRHSIEYLQFSFRWMNNLLMRELPLACTIRLWDTYLSETNGFSNFHLYVCAAFLKYWSRELLCEKDFQGLMLTLQNLPTLHWGDNEISVLVAEAYRLSYVFDDAPNHLQPRDE